MKHLLFTALLIVATTKAYAEREFIPLQVPQFGIRNSA